MSERLVRAWAEGSGGGRTFADEPEPEPDMNPQATSRMPSRSLSSSMSLPVTLTAYMPGERFSKQAREARE